ncbi:MAG: diadenylate cyclase CdaA [Clostridiaceae bacterium]|jgi:diadenylate cyclase|nr:diadenylate cyclase CdaA [Clostridiaceae bacterium]
MLTNLLNYTFRQLKVIAMTFTVPDVIQMIVLAAFVLFFYRKFIKNTKSEKFVKGVLILALGWILSEFMIAVNLRIWGMFLRTVVLLISLSLIVIFQPELRKFLGILGQAGFLNKLFSNENNNKKKDEKIDVVKEIVEAVKYLSKSHTGALMVFQGDLSHTYNDVGTTLNADLSTELILTIFHVNTPLHDGAVVINGSKIISAGTLLPLTEDPKLSWKYGTRHRAAIGMSETSDAACLVVSEETGDVSICVDGTLRKYEDLTTLKSDLEKILGYKESEDTEIEKKQLFKLGAFIPERETSKLEGKGN